LRTEPLFGLAQLLRSDTPRVPRSLAPKSRITFHGKSSRAQSRRHHVPRTPFSVLRQPLAPLTVPQAPNPLSTLSPSRLHLYLRYISHPRYRLRRVGQLRHDVVCYAVLFSGLGPPSLKAFNVPHPGAQSAGAHGGDALGWDRNQDRDGDGGWWVWG